MPSCDLKKLTLEAVTVLKNEFVKQADRYAYFQGPSTDKQACMRFILVLFDKIKSNVNRAFQDGDRSCFLH